MDTQHVFEDHGYWIWSNEGVAQVRRDQASLSYQVRRFRRTFQVQDPAGARAIFHCSADSRYKLFFNGKLLARGPAKGDVHHQFYETYDLSQELKAGRNVLAVLVMDYSVVKPYPPQLGANTSVMTYAGGFAAEGFLTDAQGAPLENLSSDEHWKVQVDTAYQFHHQNDLYGGFVGFFEHVNGAGEPTGWTREDYDDSHWEQALALYQAYYLGHRKNVSTQYGLTPRLIPMMEEGEPESFKDVFLPGGVRAPAEITDFVKSAAPLRVPARTQLTFILDAGRETTAYPRVKLSGGRGAKVRLLYAEGLRLPWEVSDAVILGRSISTDSVAIGYTDNTTGWTFDPRGKIDGYYDLYEPAGAPDETYEPFHWRAFRYIEVSIQTQDQPLELRSLTHSFTAYPFTLKADFACSDARYQKLWDISWHTFRLCTHETYEDCPYYEQLQYAGDTQITSVISMMAAADDRLTRQALLHFDWSRQPNGLTQCRYPSRHTQNLPSWSLHWIFMVADFLMHTGDREFAVSFLPGTHTVLDWFRRYKNEDGLLSALPYWNMTDWTLGWARGVCPGSNEGPTSVINAQYIHALDQAAFVLRQAEDDWTAQQFEQEAQAMRQTVNRIFWSDAEGLYYDRPGGPELSVYSNAWAILAGLPSGEQAERMLQRFPNDPRLNQASFFGHYFVFRALAQSGRYDLVGDLLGPWHHMAEAGLTAWAEDPTFWRSLCHAWSAHPMLEFLGEVLGIAPLEPGYALTQIAPKPLPGMTWAQGNIPTPMGKVEVRWEMEMGQFTLKVQSPRAMRLNIVVPGGESLQTEGGFFERSFELSGALNGSLV